MLKPANKPNVINFGAMIAKKIKCTDSVYLVGVRGYFKDEMGAKGKNDLGVYDDGIGIISPEGVITFNANTDPARHKKGVANLKSNENPGWLYKQGIHGLSKPKSLQYQAYVQATKVTVIRDGEGEDTGMFGINIHRGGLLSVSSIGCQTIVPSQWDAFNSTTKMLMKKYNQKTIRYFLMDVV